VLPRDKISGAFVKFLIDSVSAETVIVFRCLLQLGGVNIKLFSELLNGIGLINGWLPVTRLPIQIFLIICEAFVVIRQRRITQIACMISSMFFCV
jgi:hypothetical protein